MGINMQILFLSSKKNVGGPIIWKDGLIDSLSKERSIKIKELRVLDFPNLRDIIKGIKLIKKSDLIHTYTESPTILLLFLFCKIYRKPIIYTLHGDYFTQKKSKSGYKKLFLIFVNDYCLIISSKITVPSKYLLNRICKKRKFICNKIVVIPNGINLSAIRDIKPYSRKELGLIGSTVLILEITSFNYFDKAKGVIPLIEAFKQFNKKYPLSTLWIIGDGKYFTYFKSKYSIKAVQFLGQKERNEVLRLIKTSDLIIHSTFLDVFPYTVLEAIACGKPIVASNVGGIPELIKNNYNGILFNSNPEELAENMLMLMNDGSLRVRFVTNGYITVKENYTWDKVINAYLQVYRAVMTDGSR